MTMTNPRRGTAGEPERAAPAAGRQSSLLEKTGGPMGFAYSAIPVAVFVATNAFLPLIAPITISVAVGLAITAYRLGRGERFSTAAGGLLGLAVAIGVVTVTGSARDFFVVGIWAYLLVFVVTLSSVLVRRPLSGVAWNLVHGGKHSWRADRDVLRAHDVATLAAAAVSGARFAVQQWLYANDETGWLGVVRIAMGWPLTILAALVVVWAWRRSGARLVSSA
ncbi:DUF3159 domain-containing protein [Lentzea albida]|uniref:Intracellular septation protein A n=1 Tax=Lentzea albida TaxID=65499 RepID=A0A1H9WIT6_9PSEU|nr:DUF3159 domain-containing protein [Lentzea albida]SES33373.1 Protein of unknown function [Lentzea albida]